jgi:serine/threonine-protein kinase
MTVEDDIARRRGALALVRGALDRPEPGRAQWIAARAAGDVALAREALALLELDRVADPLADAAQAEADDPLEGALVGRFRIERRIGSGGMGAVYRAVPVEGAARQPVALKLVKRGMDSEEVLARFLREREILARLDHPHIARLLDGGLTADGRPWFALELVDGEPLMQWCDAQRLDIDARMALFADVCDAVAFAHRNLVVHRDLKPANVFVARAGGVKLLDFGIAKLLDGDSADATRATRQPMTPEYAAPEQFERGAITTQTDVFQLGVMLHELLGGVRAQTGSGAGGSRRLDVRLRAIAPSDAERLRSIARARSTTPTGLQRIVRGDLERIVHRATHPDPEQRYAGAAALADDLRRWRRGETVSATSDSLGYRMRTFLRRHRVAASATAAVVLALVAGLGLAMREADRARHAEHATEEALALLETVFLGADPYEGKGANTRATDLLARAKERVLGGDLLGDPAIAARLLAEIGETYVSLGDRGSADAALRDAVRMG